MTHRHPRRSSSGGALDLDPRSHQLCSQAFESLSLSLASSRDPALLDASILGVRPHPDAGRLLVVVTAPLGLVRDVEEALSRARSHLRTELAAEINRKRAPELAFVVLPDTSPERDEGAR